MSEMTAHDVLGYLFQGKTPPLSETDRDAWDRLWSKVDVRRNVKDCWPWLRGCSYRENNHSLGVFQDNINGRKVVGTPQRAVFRLTRGRLPVGARATCGDSLCCNPDHVDETRRGKPSHLTPQQVAEIEALPEWTTAALARRFVTTPASIRYIRRAQKRRVS